MHAMQILPLVGWLIGRRRNAVKLVVTIAASYAGVFGVLAWQAFRAPVRRLPPPKPGRC